MIEKAHMDISVVIPVYNVEKYLRKCVDSILNQTISNYEVILVDDGSPDGCPSICDEYAAQHANVSALHKANGGLSDARNYGVQHASAEYVVFVDSDDYVDPEYLESLWKLHMKYDADIAVQGVTRENEVGKPLHIYRSVNEAIVTPEEAIGKICTGQQVPIFAYAKLYPKQFLLRTPYPVGKLHEDIFTTYRLFDQCKVIALGRDSFYHYIVRQGSIVNSTFTQRHMDSIQGAKELITFVEQKYPAIKNAANVRMAIEVNSLIHRAAQSEHYYEVRKNALKELQGKWHIVLCTTKLSVKVKLQLVLCRISANIYKQLFLLVKDGRKKANDCICSRNDSVGSVQ